MALHRGLVLLLVLDALSVALGGGMSFTVNSCLDGGSYFDTASLQCVSCLSSTSPLRQVDNSSSDMYGSPRGCTCAVGSSVVPRVCDMASNALCAQDTCSVCPTNQTSTRDGKACMPCGSPAVYLGPGRDCACPAQQALVERSSQGVQYAAKGCTPCAPRTRLFLVPTGIFPGDAYSCASCSDPHSYVTAAGACACDSGYTPSGLGGALGARSAAGATSVECVPAAAATLVNTNYPKATLQTFNNLGVSTVSLVFYALFTTAAVGCKGYTPGDAAAARHCHALANLCTLALHDPRQDACKLLGTLGGAFGASGKAHALPLGWQAGFPLLTWAPGTTKALALDADSLPAGMTYAWGAARGGNTFSALRFFLAQWALNGTFLGLRRLRNQLAYCTPLGDGAPYPPWLTFGYSWSERTVCDLGALLAAGAVSYGAGSPSLALREPVFYDLYVQDMAADSGGRGQAGLDASVGGGGSSLLASVLSQAMATGVFDYTRLPITLVPVAVRVTNYIGAAGTQPNVNQWFSDEADDVYTGRFTLFDAASGASATDGLPAPYVRYASSVLLTILGQPSPGGAVSMQIFPPVLTMCVHVFFLGGGGRMCGLSLARCVFFLSFFLPSPPLLFATLFLRSNSPSLPLSLLPSPLSLSTPLPPLTQHLRGKDPVQHPAEPLCGLQAHGGVRAEHLRQLHLCAHGAGRVHPHAGGPTRHGLHRGAHTHERSHRAGGRHNRTRGPAVADVLYFRLCRGVLLAHARV